MRNLLFEIKKSKKVVSFSALVLSAVVLLGILFPYSTFALGESKHSVLFETRVGDTAQQVQNGTVFENISLPSTLRGVVSLAPENEEKIIASSQETKEKRDTSVADVFEQVAPELNENNEYDYVQYGYTAPADEEQLRQNNQTVLYTFADKNATSGTAYRVYGIFANDTLANTEDEQEDVPAWYACDEKGIITGKVQDIEVTWNADNYNAQKAGSYTLYAEPTSDKFTKTGLPVSETIVVSSALNATTSISSSALTTQNEATVNDTTQDTTASSNTVEQNKSIINDVLLTEESKLDNDSQKLDLPSLVQNMFSQPDAYNLEVEKSDESDAQPEVRDNPTPFASNEVELTKATITYTRDGTVVNNTAVGVADSSGLMSFDTALQTVESNPTSAPVWKATGAQGTNGAISNMVLEIWYIFVVVPTIQSNVNVELKTTDSGRSASGDYTINEDTKTYILYIGKAGTTTTVQTDKSVLNHYAYSAGGTDADAHPVVTVGAEDASHTAFIYSNGISTVTMDRVNFDADDSISRTKPIFRINNTRGGFSIPGQNVPITGFTSWDIDKWVFKGSDLSKSTNKLELSGYRGNAPFMEVICGRVEVGLVATTALPRGVNGLSVHDNETESPYGTICMGSYLTITGASDFYDNIAGRGGAIYLGNRGQEAPVLTNQDVVGNVGFAAEEDTRIYNNQATKFSSSPLATGDGGAIYVSANNIFKSNSVYNVKIYGNAAEQNGGALYTEKDGIIDLWKNTEFKTNTAQVDGGCVYNLGITVFRGYFNELVNKPTDKSTHQLTNNTAQRNGGGIYSKGFLYVGNGTILTLDSNEAVTGSGGGIYLDGDNGNSKLSVGGEKPNVPQKLNLPYAVVDGFAPYLTVTNNTSAGNGAGIYQGKGSRFIFSGAATATTEVVTPGAITVIHNKGPLLNSTTGSQVENNLYLANAAIQTDPTTVFDGAEYTFLEMYDNLADRTDGQEQLIGVLTDKSDAEDVGRLANNTSYTGKIGTINTLIAQAGVRDTSSSKHDLLPSQAYPGTTGNKWFLNDYKETTTNANIKQAAWNIVKDPRTDGSALIFQGRVKVSFTRGSGATGTLPDDIYLAFGETFVLPGKGDLTNKTTDFLGWKPINLVSDEETAGYDKVYLESETSFPITHDTVFEAQWTAGPGITKRDSLTGLPITNKSAAEFKWQNMVQAGNDFTAVTDNDGRLIFYDSSSTEVSIPATGRYRVTETKAPGNNEYILPNATTGYWIIDVDFEAATVEDIYTLYQKGSSAPEFNFSGGSFYLDNAPVLHAINFEKWDADANQLLTTSVDSSLTNATTAQFTLVGPGSVTYTGVSNITTGKIEFTRGGSPVTSFPAGDYTLTETTVPSNYDDTLNKEWTFTVSTVDNAAVVINSSDSNISATGTTVKVSNKRKTIANLPNMQKIDSADITKGLAGAQFLLTPAFGNTTTTYTSTVSVSSTGAFTFNTATNIPWGAYTVKEIVAPTDAGYESNINSEWNMSITLNSSGDPQYSFSIKSGAMGGNATITANGDTIRFPNLLAKSTLSFYKTDVDTGQPVSGIDFELRETLTSTDPVAKGTSATNGLIDFIDVTTNAQFEFSVGKTYYITESATNLLSKGYIQPSTGAHWQVDVKNNNLATVSVKPSSETNISCEAMSGNATNGSTDWKLGNKRQRITELFVKKDRADFANATNLGNAEFTFEGEGSLPNFTAVSDTATSNLGVLKFKDASGNDVTSIPQGNYKITETQTPSAQYESGYSWNMVTTVDASGNLVYTFTTNGSFANIATYNNGSRDEIAIPNKLSTTDLTFTKEDAHTGQGIANINFNVFEYNDATSTMGTTAVATGKSDSTGAITFTTMGSTTPFSFVNSTSYAIMETSDSVTTAGYTPPTANAYWKFAVTSSGTVASITPVGDAKGVIGQKQQGSTGKDWILTNTRETIDVSSLFKKIDGSELTSGALAGAEFTFVPKTTGLPSYTAVSGSNGVLQFKNSSNVDVTGIFWDDYTITETVTPTGYKTGYNWTMSAVPTGTTSGGFTYTFTPGTTPTGIENIFRNTATPSPEQYLIPNSASETNLTFKKYDINTKAPIENINFELFRNNVKVADAVSGADGTLTFKKAGTQDNFDFVNGNSYELKEVTGSSWDVKYALPDANAKWDIVVGLDGNATVTTTDANNVLSSKPSDGSAATASLEWTLFNTRKGVSTDKLFKKVASATNTSQVLAGAEFSITPKTTGLPSYTAVSGADGYLVFKNSSGTIVTEILWGEYTITETIAPTGYDNTGMSWDMNITIDSSGNAVFDFPTYPSADLKIIEVTANKEYAIPNKILGNTLNFYKVDGSMLNRPGIENVGFRLQFLNSSTGVVEKEYTGLSSGTTGLINFVDSSNQPLTVFEGGKYILKEDSTVPGAADYSTVYESLNASAQWEIIVDRDASGNPKITITPSGGAPTPEGDVTTGFKFTNERMKGSVKNINLLKVDSRDNTLGVAGAIFDFKAEANGPTTIPSDPQDPRVPAEYTAVSQSDGSFKFYEGTATSGTEVTDMKWGTYTLQEREAPAGYEKITTTWTIKLNQDTSAIPWIESITPTLKTTGSGSTLMYLIENPIKQVNVIDNLYKSDAISADVHLAGAEFTVTEKVGGKEYKAISNSAGKIEFFDLSSTTPSVPLTTMNIGEYTLVETKAPTNYSISTGNWVLTIAEDASYTLVEQNGAPAPGTDSAGNKVIFDNSIPLNVDGLLYKKDYQTKKGIEGAEFTFTGKVSKAVYTAVSDSTGKLSFKDSTNTDITLLPQDTYAVVETTIPPADGIGSYNEATWTMVVGPDTATTAKISSFTVDNILAQTDDKYVPNPTFTSPSWDIWNTRERVSIDGLLTKVDATTSSPLNGAVFTFKLENTTDTFNSYTWTSGTDGKITITRDSDSAVMTSLPWGKYELTETTAPTGYALAPSAWNITIDATQTTYKTQITVTQAPTPALDFKANATDTGWDIPNLKKSVGLTIYKSDALNETLYLDGAEFTFVSPSKTYTATATGTSNQLEFKEGSTVVTEIDDGTYVVTETVAPTGYTKPSGTWTIVVDANATNPIDLATIIKSDSSMPDIKQNAAGDYLILNDREKQPIAFTKVDAINNKIGLADAEFTIEGIDNSISTTAKSNASGLLIFNPDIQTTGLPFGRYRITETVAPKNYVTIPSTSSWIIELHADASEPTVSIDGASDNIDNLILEKQANNSYNVLIPNKRTLTEFNFVKVGEDISTIPATSAEFKLILKDDTAGANVIVNYIAKTNVGGLTNGVFQFYKLVDDGSGGVTEELVSNAMLPWGDYTLIETKAPQDYNLPENGDTTNNWSIKVTPNDTATVITDKIQVTNNGTVKSASDAGAIYIMNEKALVPFNFYKVDGAAFDSTTETGTKLDGAGFKLYKWNPSDPLDTTKGNIGDVVYYTNGVNATPNWELVEFDLDGSGTLKDMATSGENGTPGYVDFGRLKDGVYTLVEVQAPTGNVPYVVPIGQWEFTIDFNTDMTDPINLAPKSSSILPLAWMKGSISGNYYVQNMYIPLPMSGLTGVYPYIAAGIMISGVSITLFILSKRKNKYKNL